MYSTIRFGTASKATPQGRRLYRAGVGFKLAIKQSPARRHDHSATTSLELLLESIHHLSSHQHYHDEPVQIFTVRVIVPKRPA
jgi:hypothetical protein